MKYAGNDVRSFLDNPEHNYMKELIIYDLLSRVPEHSPSTGDKSSKADDIEEIGVLTLNAKYCGSDRTAPVFGIPTGFPAELHLA
jgi:hypothetical protein